MPIKVGKRYRVRQRRRSWSIYVIAAGVSVLTFAVGMVVTTSPAGSPSVKQLASMANISRFNICVGPVRRTCVVDGDTIWLDGEKIRIADIDTPEISEPQCQSEYDRGIQSRDRLAELLNAGEFDVLPIGDRDQDQFGRKLRVLVRNGQSLGDQLVSEGLARTWTGAREPWC